MNRIFALLLLFVYPVVFSACSMEQHFFTPDKHEKAFRTFQLKVNDRTAAADILFHPAFTQ